MDNLTRQAREFVQRLAQQYGVTQETVYSLLQSLRNSGGSMAQFRIPELGGSGQWMRGGMTMVGDMFNNQLKSTVDGLCGQLSELLAQGEVFMQPQQTQPSGFQQQQQGSGFQQQGGTYSSGNWWPAELGVPSSSGAQNNMQYAYFPDSRRLATNINGQISVYDTLDHQISGVSQQQSGTSSVSFSSQYGTVFLENLPLISGPGTTTHQQPQKPPQQAAPHPQMPQSPSPTSQVNTSNPQSSEEIFATIEKLAALKEKGILSDEEFAQKKSELLSRL